MASRTICISTRIAPIAGKMLAWHLKLPVDDGSEARSPQKATPDDLVRSSDLPLPTWPPHEDCGGGNPCYMLKVMATSPTRGELTWKETSDMKKRHGPGPIPGHDVVGQVAFGCTKPSKYKTGDFVYGLIDFDRNGAAAQFVTAYEHEICVFSIPKSVSLKSKSNGPNDAAMRLGDVTPIHRLVTMPTAGLTAWQALFDGDKGGLDEPHSRGQLTVTLVHPPRKILITGATGAVGALAVQLAHEARSRTQPLHITALAAPLFAGMVKKFGADVVCLPSEIDHAAGAFGPFDLVLELTGGKTREMLLSKHKLTPGDNRRLETALLTPDGRVVSITAPLKVAVPGLTPRELCHLVDRFRFFIIKPNVRQLETLLALINEGRLELFCHNQVYMLENAADAFKECERRWRTTLGKVIIHVADP